jgi:thiamine pyrophosphokinase
MSKRIIIFAAGEYFQVPAYKPSDGNSYSDGKDFIIAVDGGYKYCTEHAINPDMIIGDFDSLGNIPTRGNVIVLPRVKDDTDTAAAVSVGLNAGYDEFHIYGGTGGRLDHTLANIALVISLAQSGKRAFLFDNGSVITAVSNAQISFMPKPGGTISVFAATDRADGVTLSGLKYTLEQAVIYHNIPLGVSNEFTEKSASVSVKSGTLLIIFDSGAKLK